MVAVWVVELARSRETVVGGAAELVSFDAVRRMTSARTMGLATARAEVVVAERTTRRHMMAFSEASTG